MLVLFLIRGVYSSITKVVKTTLTPKYFLGSLGPKMPGCIPDSMFELSAEDLFDV